MNARKMLSKYLTLIPSGLLFETREEALRVWLEDFHCALSSITLLSSGANSDEILRWSDQITQLYGIKALELKGVLEHWTANGSDLDSVRDKFISHLGSAFGSTQESARICLQRLVELAPQHYGSPSFLCLELISGITPAEFVNDLLPG